jgi:hypothetical protein
MWRRKSGGEKTFLKNVCKFVPDVHSHTLPLPPPKKSIHIHRSERLVFCCIFELHALLTERGAELT